jgi:glutamate-1-semialdehyde 2,1-aminomutase
MPNGVPTSWMATLYEHPPIVVKEGSGGAFRDVDGNAYLDFNLADTSMYTGHGVEAVARAAGERVAAGSQFLLPTEDAAEVAEELGRRFGLPSWQFTLSATQANTEAIRVARAVTGRSVVLMFDGKYHGHADELLGMLDDARVVPEGLGVPPDATRHVRLVQYNDLEAVERELARGDVACVLAEAAVTNTGVIQPADGFHAALRRLVSDRGALLVIDETHTLVAGPGGLTATWGLEPDMLVMGKSIASGIPLGAYGMTTTVARALEHCPSATYAEEVATGGTLFGNALSLAAARVTLAEVLTDGAYEHAAARRTAGRRHRERRRRERHAVARPTAVQSLGLHARAGASRQRARGAGHLRHRALQRPAPLHGQPRRLGGDRLGRPRVRHPDERGRRRPLSRGPGRFRGRGDVRSGVAQLLVPRGATLGSEVEEVPDRLEGADVAGVLSGLGRRVQEL